MTKREMIGNELAKMGYSVGCWHDKIEKLTAKQFRTLLDEMYEESTDVKFKSFIISIDTMDDEKDFAFYTIKEYENTFGEIANR